MVLGWMSRVVSEAERRPAWSSGSVQGDRGVGRCKILGRLQVQVARRQRKYTLVGGGCFWGDITPSDADKLENSTLNEANWWVIIVKKLWKKLGPLSRELLPCVLHTNQLTAKSKEGGVWGGICPPQVLKKFENLTLNGVIWWVILGKKIMKKIRTETSKSQSPCCLVFCI